MKAIKITTADGKSITAGHEGAIWITVEYSVYPKENKSRYNVYAVVLQANRETFKHEWTPLEQSSPVVKLKTIETEAVDSPLSTHQWPIEVNEGKVSLFKRLLYAFSNVFGNAQVRIDEDDSKFVPPIAIPRINPFPDTPVDDLTKISKDLIPGQVPVGVIVCLKMIQIEKNE